MNGLRTAVAFLTVLPARPRFDAESGRRAVRWYAPVGLGLGALLAALALATGWLLPPLASAALLVAAWAVVTGALHIDGVADCADGAIAAVPPARRLEIAHDVHHGTFAVVAVTGLLLLKTAALATPARGDAAALLLVAPVAGRAATVVALRTWKPARPDGMAASARAGATTAAAIVALGLCAAAGLVALGPQGLLVAAAAVAAGVLLAWRLVQRFGGLTGDVCGAAIECGEAAALIVGAAVLQHGANGFPRWGPL